MTTKKTVWDDLLSGKSFNVALAALCERANPRWKVSLAETAKRLETLEKTQPRNSRHCKALLTIVLCLVFGPMGVAVVLRATVTGHYSWFAAVPITGMLALFGVLGMKSIKCAKIIKTIDWEMVNFYEEAIRLFKIVVSKSRADSGSEIFKLGWWLDEKKGSADDLAQEIENSTKALAQKIALGNKPRHYPDLMDDPNKHERDHLHHIVDLIVHLGLLETAEKYPFPNNFYNEDTLFKLRFNYAYGALFNRLTPYLSV